MGEEKSSMIGRLSVEDVTRFIKKPTPVELFLLTGGNLWDVLFDTFLKDDTKSEDMKEFLKAIKHLPYRGRYLDHHGCDLKLHMRILNLIYLKDNRSEYSDAVVEFVKSFFISEDILDFLTLGYEKLKFIFESCQKERFRLISQQGQPGFISDVAAVQIFSYDNLGNIFRYLLISGVSFDFSIDVFTRLKKYFLKRNHNMFHLSVDDNKSLIRQNLRRGNLQVMYRAMQTIQIYYLNDMWAALKLIRFFWISIPDPFLTKEDFDGIFSGLNFRYDGEYQSWYAHEIKLPADWMKQPRSLRHISRCAVRRRLAESFQLSNIESLALPKKLRSYLNWEDLEDIY